MHSVPWLVYTLNYISIFCQGLVEPGAAGQAMKESKWGGKGQERDVSYYMCRADTEVWWAFVKGLLNLSVASDFPVIFGWDAPWFTKTISCNWWRNGAKRLSSKKNKKRESIRRISAIGFGHWQLFWLIAREENAFSRLSQKVIFKNSVVS